MSSLGSILLRWFERYGRTLPWRSDPQPYAVVVSEFMLQQTQVDRVLPKFAAFIERFPGFAALALAARPDVVRAWQGLGYNSRALRLHELARSVMRDHAGVLPDDPVTLARLPGIGPYTGAAIRAFAFNQPVIAVDTNVRRVAHRVHFGLEYPAAHASREVADAAQGFFVRGRARDVNGALMDLGSTICTVRAPKCLLCPLRSRCAAAPVDAARLEGMRRAAQSRSRPATPFHETTRYARGRIIDVLRSLPPGAGISLLDLREQLDGVPALRDERGLRGLLERLERDGLVDVRAGAVALAEA